LETGLLEMECCQQESGTDGSPWAVSEVSSCELSMERNEICDRLKAYMVTADIRVNYQS